MEEKEITALAREYAEWVTNAEGGNNAYIPAETAIASVFLRWLCKRFYLVEKTEVKRLLKEHRKENRGTDQGSRAWFFYNGRLDLLKSLFPEIGKEVDS